MLDPVAKLQCVLAAIQRKGPFGSTQVGSWGHFVHPGPRGSLKSGSNDLDSVEMTALHWEITQETPSDQSLIFVSTTTNMHDPQNRENNPGICNDWNMYQNNISLSAGETLHPSASQKHHRATMRDTQHRKQN
jgi:hypothetical protein